MKDIEQAFHWIINILERHNIVYKISGGLAARVHGVNRELADIDIDVANRDIPKIVEDVKAHIIFGPDQYADAHWDLELMTLKYADQEIDIAGNEARIFNRGIRQWEDYASNLETVEIKQVFGREVPIESLVTLIGYKSKLARDVDLEDIRQLKAISVGATLQ